MVKGILTATCLRDFTATPNDTIAISKMINEKNKDELLNEIRDSTEIVTLL